MHRRILPAILFIVVSSSLLANTIRCSLAGKIIGRNSKAILLSKTNSKLQDENAWTRIPIINSQFHYEMLATEEEMYQLIFEEELNAGSWSAIHFFPFEGQVTFQLYPQADFKKNDVEGGPLNMEYQNFSKRLNSAHQPVIDDYYKQSDSLRKVKDYERKEYRDLIEKWKVEKDPAKKQYLLEEFTVLQKTGEAFTETGRRARTGLDSCFSLRNDLIYEYIKANTTIPAYFYLSTMAPLARQNRLAANTMAEAYPRFAAAFPKHPYTLLVGSQIEGILKIRPGEKLMDITIPDLNGNLRSLKTETAGKIVLLDFWGSWCGPCIAKTRQVVPIYEKYKSRGFIIIGIAREYKNADAMKKRIAMEKWDWLQLIELNDQYKAWAKFGITDATGMLLLVDKNGTIVSVDPSPEDVESFLQKNN